MNSMKVHLELAQESRRRLPLEVEFGHIGRVLNIRNTQSCQCSAVAGGPSITELDGSKYFIRLSRESFLDLDGPQLEALSDRCVAARRSEEFFLIANATDQWLRTVIGHEDLHPETWTEAKTWKKVIPGIIIHSNVLPYHPYWSNLQTTKHGSVHFPSHILQEALEEGKTLKTKLKDTGKEFCGIGSGRYRCGNENCERTSKVFRDIQPADVKLVRSVSKGILLITWRGGQFVQKVDEGGQKVHEGAQTSFDMELEVVKRLFHPNIVYSFGKLDQTSYFMESMSNDLLKVIVDRIDREVGDNKPPFVAHEAVDVLSQVAKAMRHMHQENVNVVHCDLKSQNILVSEIETPYNHGKHNLVKVADFGSARLLGNSSSGTTDFIAGDGTTNYSAPEVLQQRKDNATKTKTKQRLIEFPHKIDVYSFGIVAFEVLTGTLTIAFYKDSPSKFKKGVIEDTWRPPLRAECEKHKEFIQDKELISLIEKCWHQDPKQRPSFVEICDELDKARVRLPLIPEQILQSHNPEPHQVHSIMKCLQGLRLPGKNKKSKKSKKSKKNSLRRA